MTELGLVAFIAAFLALGIRRPFLWVLAYLYIDILAPQKFTWMILPKLQISLVVFLAALGGWLV